MVKSYYDQYRTIYKVERWNSVDEPIGPAHEVKVSEISYLATDELCIALPNS
jgi:hypothetical protein